MNRKKVRVCIVSVFLLILVQSVVAINLDITPIKDSTTVIENKDCGKETPVNFTINNKGGGGALCWYWTNYDTEKRKLTSKCVDPHTTSTYNAHITMPSSGSKKVELQLECYDFQNCFLIFCNDACNDTYTYSYAVEEKYSGGAEEAFDPRYFDLSCSRVSIDVSTTETSIEMFSGEERDVSIEVRNNGDHSVQCNHKGGKTLGRIESGQSTPFYVKISADSGSGTTSRSVEVQCTDEVTGKIATDSVGISITYRPDPCGAAVESATSSYNNAVKKVDEADATIQGAPSKCEGVDTTNAINFKNQARSYLINAQSLLDNSRTSWSGGDTSNSQSQASDSKRNSELVVDYATRAENAVQQAITDCLSGRKEASDMIQQTESKISSAQSWIDRAESVVSNGTDLGMDTHQEKADAQTAKSTLSNAKTYHQQASTYFDAKNYDLTKQNANEAIKYAENAENSAKKAYNALYKTVEDAQTATKEMNIAVSEISTADQTFSKLAVIVRNLKKTTDVSSIEATINELRGKIDSARDSHSQAQNKFSAGYYSQSVDLATQARNTAASANNRLSGVVEDLTVTVTDSLDKAYASSTTKIEEAKAKVIDAAGTYAAGGDDITLAQNAIQQAEIALENAKVEISKAKSTTDLTQFLTAASNAFSRLEEVETKTEESKTKAKAAINSAYAKVIGAGAAVVATGGAGFVYWRRKQKKKKKVERKPEKKPSKKSCKKCREDYPLDYNICPKCGEKLIPE